MFGVAGVQAAGEVPRPRHPDGGGGKNDKSALQDYDEYIASAPRIEGGLLSIGRDGLLFTTPVVRGLAATTASGSRRTASLPGCPSSTAAWWYSRTSFAPRCAAR